MTVIKINAITVPAEMGPEVASRFAARVGSVDGAPGFEGFELLRPTDDRTQWLVVTRWADEDSFEAWRASPSFGEGHKTPAAGEGPPAGHGGPGGPGGHGGGEGGERPSPMGLTAELWSYEVQVASTGGSD